jgi:acyl-CoA thioesterase-1
MPSRSSRSSRSQRSFRHARAAAPVVLVVGDSISAAYGSRPAPAGSTSVGAPFERALSASRRQREHHRRHDRGGRARLPALLMRYKPDVWCSSWRQRRIARRRLGSTRDNLAAMVEARSAPERSRSSSACSCRRTTAPLCPKFDALFGEVAKAHKAPLVPFFSKVSANATNVQADRIQHRAAARAVPQLPLLGRTSWPQGARRPLLVAEAQ